MNKNSFMAFILIIGAVMFFGSPTYNKFYTEKILKKEYVRKGYIKNDKELDKKQKNESNLLQKNDSETVTDTVTVKSDTIWIENEKIKVGIKEIGATIVSIEMKEYKEGKDNRNIKLINDTIGGVQLTIGNKNYDDKYFKYYGENKKIKVDKEQSITFKYDENKGEELKKIYSLNKNDYTIGLIIEKNNLSGEKITIGWDCGIDESEKNGQKNIMLKKVVHLSSGDNVQHYVLKKNEKEGPIAGRYDWIGITSKYFFIALNNESIKESDIKIETKTNNEKQLNYQFEISRMAESNKEKFSIYAGPKKRDEIKKYNRNYEKILFPVIGWTKIFFWSDIWFPWLADKVLLLLLLIQKCVKDYGIAIIIITIITKVITYPLTLSSMKSMEKMKNIQPKINKIRDKFKNNPQKMNEEIMALYKKEGVNPLDPGCLPMFLQMPIFISLYVVLQNAIEIRGTTTILVPWIKDLSRAEEIISIAHILPNGIPMYGTNIALLPIIMAILTYFQQKATIKDPNQKMLIYFMPIFMLFLFNSFPSGLVLYWTFSNALQLLQQFLVNKNKENVVELKNSPTIIKK